MPNIELNFLAPSTHFSDDLVVVSLIFKSFGISWYS